MTITSPPLLTDIQALDRFDGGSLRLSGLPSLHKPIVQGLKTARRLDIDEETPVPTFPNLQTAEAISIGGEVVDCDFASALRLVGEGELGLGGGGDCSLFPLLTDAGTLHIEVDELAALHLPPALGHLDSLYLSATSLGELDGLDALATVDGDLTFDALRGLSRIPALPALASVGGDLQVDWATELTTLGGFPALRSVGGALRLTNSRYLTDLSAFSALQTVGGDLELTNLVRLVDLDDLGALQGVNGSVLIEDNAHLVRVDGLGALQTVGGDLNILNNAWLRTSRAEALGLILQPFVVGTITIDGNAEG